MSCEVASVVSAPDVESSDVQALYEEVARNPALPSLRGYNLTISHRHKFIWFRVGMVATRTILRHLHEQTVLDVEHASYIRYAPEQFRDYFKFAFVRNPWDRLVSCWLGKVINGHGLRMTAETREAVKLFPAFVEYMSTLDLSSCDRHLQMQCDLIDLNNLDFLGRFETFADDYAHVCAELGLSPAALAHWNVGYSREHYPCYYTPALREIVRRSYARDVQMFGYRFDGVT